MSKHTLGPWEAGFYKLTPTVFDSAGNGTIPIATIHDMSKGDIQANARLIAAAPELLEAAEASEAWHIAESQNLGSFHDKMNLCSYSEWATRKALAKAKGLEFTEEFEGVPRLLVDLRSYTPRIEKINEEQALELASVVTKATKESDNGTVIVN